MILMVTAVINRIRIKAVRLMWHCYGLMKIARWFILSLALLIGIILYAGLTTDDTYLYLGLGYLTGGLCWIISVRLSAATLVTDFAVIRRTSGKGNVLGWSQVTDFFIHKKKSVIHYVFLYREIDGTQSRFELKVPAAYQTMFEKVVHRRVEKKILPARERAYG